MVEKYYMIKGKRMNKDGNTFNFNYEIRNKETNITLEVVKSWFKVRPLTMEERKNIVGSELSIGIIDEWDSNGLKIAEEKLNKNNK